MKIIENKKRAILFLLLFVMTFLGSTIVFAEDRDFCGSLFEEKSFKGRFYRNIDRVLGVNESWEFSVAREEEFKTIYEDPSLPDREKHQRLFQSLIAARVSGVNRVSAHFLESMVRDVFEQNSLYSRTLGRFLYPVSGPHYNSIANRIVMDPISGDDIRDLVVAMHEIQHGYDRNAKPFLSALEAYLQFYDFFMIIPTPSTPAVHYRSESQAVGAQWEFARRIPEDYRKRLIKALRVQFLKSLLAQNINYLFKNDVSKVEMKEALLQILNSSPNSITRDLVGRCEFDDFDQAIRLLSQQHTEGNLARGLMQSALTESVLATLEYSKFSREEFLSRLMVFHGYALHDLVAAHYRLSPMKGLLISSTIYTLWNLIEDHGSVTPTNALNWVDEFYANDVRLLVRLVSIISHFFLPVEDDSVIPVGSASSIAGSNARRS